MTWLRRLRNRRSRRAAHRALRLVNAQLAQRAEDLLVLDSSLIVRLLWVRRG